MLPLTRSRNRARFFGTPFSPAALFAGGTVAGAWYDPSDLSTLFTTSAGTTQCAMPGQGSAVSVGLMLDKSQGLVLGPELVDTGNTTAGWIAYGANVVSQISNGVSIQFVNDGRGAKTIFQQAGNLSSDLVAGKTYEFTFTVSINTGTATISLANFTTPPSTITITTTPQNVIFRSSRTAFAPELEFNGMGAGQIISITAISVRELPGNHAIAFNDTTARPELRARVNLLTWSENWADPAWSNSGMTVGATGVSDPFGGNSAFTIRATVTNSGNQIFQSNNTVSVGTSIFYSLWVRRRTGTGTVRVKNPNGVNFTDITSVLTSSWQRFTLTSVPNPNGFFYPGLTVETLNDEVDVYGADLRPANIGANVPAYQRIADANTYDTAGFPLYLRFDGIDDSMYTPANLNLSGTDKVSVFAGVRKFNNTTQQFIVETSTNASINNGSFALLTNTNSGGGLALSAYGGLFRGTSNAGYGAAGTTAPISNVVTLLGNIAAATDAVIMRVNGAQVATSGATSAGAGNFGSYPTYIASRQGVAPNLLEGHLHSLIIAGSAVSAGNISATEQWVAGKTGIQI